MQVPKNSSPHLLSPDTFHKFLVLLGFLRVCGCIFGVALQVVNGARRRRNGENVIIKGPSLNSDNVIGFSDSPHIGIQ